VEQQQLKSTAVAGLAAARADLATALGELDCASHLAAMDELRALVAAEKQHLQHDCSLFGAAECRGTIPF
jgi:hypothetical protein